MAGRDLTAGMVSGFTAGVIRPVLIGRFDIVSDPLTAWTGPGTLAPSGTGDAQLNGQVFVNVAPFIELSDVQEDQGIGGPVQITVSGHDLDEDLLRQVVRDQRVWRGQPAYLWIGLLNADEATVISDPVRNKTGVMTNMMVNRQRETAEVVVTIDADLGKARDAPWRWTDHALIYPADTWSTYIMALYNQPEGITDSPIKGAGPNDPLPGGRTLPGREDTNYYG